MAPMPAVGGQGRALMIQNFLLLLKYTPPLKPFYPAALAYAQKTGDVATTDHDTSGESHAHRVSMGMARRDHFALKPPKGVINGTLRGAKNMLVAFIAPPLLLALAPIGAVVRLGAPGFLPAVAHAVIWAPATFLIAFIGAFQQVALGFYITLMAPKKLAVDLHRWHPLSRSYVPYTTAADPVLFEEAPNEEMLHQIGLEAAQRRVGHNTGGPSGGSRNSDDDGGPGSLYRTLRVKKNADSKQIKEAYSRLALELHPDKNPDPSAREQFDEVTKAYRILSSAKKRKEYDSGAKVKDGQMEMKKRDGLTNIFGGEKIHSIIGDLRTGRFSRRYVDELVFYGDQTQMYNLRRAEKCPQNLLALLDGYELGSAGAASAWSHKMAKMIKAVAVEGLGTAVLDAVGSNFVAAVEFLNAPTITRVQLYLQQDVIAKQRNRIECGLDVARASKEQRNSPQHVVTTLWKMCIPDFRENCFEVAKTLILDETASEQERERRKEGIKELGKLMVKAGKPFEGANDATLRALSKAMQSQGK